MSVFDQRGQKVNTQYNVAGNLNFGTVQTRADFISEIEKLKSEVRRAQASTVVDEDTAAEMEYRLSKVSSEAKKPQPQQSVILQYLNEAKALIEGVSAAAGLVTLFVQASQVIRSVFP